MDIKFENDPLSRNTPVINQGGFIDSGGEIFICPLEKAIVDGKDLWHKLGIEVKLERLSFDILDRDIMRSDLISLSMPDGVNWDLFLSFEDGVLSLDINKNDLDDGLETNRKILLRETNPETFQLIQEKECSLLVYVVEQGGCFDIHLYADNDIGLNPAVELVNQPTNTDLEYVAA